MKHQGPASTDPREPIIRRLAERLGVPFEAIAGDGTNPPRIEVDLDMGRSDGCGWRHAIRYRWNTADTSMLEIYADGTVETFGNPPETWEPALTISSADLVAALAAAARDLEEMFNADH